MLAALLMIGGFTTVAQASHWATTGEDCYDPTPYDEGSCDAYSKIYWGGPAPGYYATGWFDAYGERVKVKNAAAQSMKWHLYVYDRPDPSGYVGAGDCIEWGRSTRDGCPYIGGWDISEGKIAELEICVRWSGDDHWDCTRHWGLT